MFSYIWHIHRRVFLNIVLRLGSDADSSQTTQKSLECEELSDSELTELGDPLFGESSTGPRKRKRVDYSGCGTCF